MTSQAMLGELEGIPEHVLEMAEYLFDHWCPADPESEESVIPGMLASASAAEKRMYRREFFEVANRWNVAAFPNMSHCEREYAEAAKHSHGITKHNFKLWVGEHFKEFSPKVCNVAQRELTAVEPPSGSQMSLFRQLWMMQLFDVVKPQNSDKLDYEGFAMLVKCYSPDIDDETIDQSFNRLLGVMVTTGKRKKATELSFDLFADWTATIFEEYDDDQFKGGMMELIKDVSEALEAESESEETSESESDEFDDEIGHPTQGIEVENIFEALNLEEMCGDMLTNAEHTVWRTLKSRKLVVSMIETARDEFISFLARFEYHRQELTKASGMDVDETCWPPSSNAQLRIAQRVIPSAWEAVDSSDFALKLRKLLIQEFLARVNTTRYANGMLRNHMQALVLAITDVIVEETTGRGVQQLVEAVDAACALTACDSPV